MASTAADHPRRIPLVRAWHVAKVVYVRIGTDNLGVVAAGCAFYALLALFPFLAALISVYGLLSDPAAVSEQLQLIEGTVPDQVYDIVSAQVQQLSAQDASLSLGLILSTSIALYSSTKGVKAVMRGLNIVYDETEQRNIIMQNLVALGLTAGFVIGMTIALLVVVVTPVVLGLLGLGQGITGTLVDLARWSILAIGLFGALAVIYRIAPNRRPARFQWLTWGAVVAAVLWLAASMLFSFYVANFASYNETYGSLGAVVVLLMWFFIGAYAVLIGGEINAELERGTARDSTVGPERPPGKRGAVVADHQPQAKA
ncbi:Ribonuclease BN [Caenispirillum salinarum AK4]|uniref:Ribonuclease BN n=1 Tax=Caenispirillum salinarum AK4 TaxID=1238182 RepID=K9GQH2_9PROT|nr:YihY/virulence factor BrkB family protein [Caenispirillum salinarum]EKV28205.1 Ribonuclease BN [Caenispirillum salinarum AK4]